VVLAVRGSSGGAATPGSGLAPAVTPHDRGYGFRGGLGDFSPPTIEEVRGDGRRQCGGAARAPPQPWAVGGRLAGPEGQDVEG
jgi:hypothetical protein